LISSRNNTAQKTNSFTVGVKPSHHYLPPTYPAFPQLLRSQSSVPYYSYWPTGETGIGGVGNKKVTSKGEYMYQRLDGEASISCRCQQVSQQSQVTWSPWLRPGPITGRLFQIVLTKCWLQVQCYY